MVVDLCRAVYVTDVGRASLEAEVVCLRQLQKDLITEQLHPPYTVELETSRSRPITAELAAIEREARRLELVLREAITLGDGDNRVGVGSTVWLHNAQGRRFMVRLVGPITANPAAGLVSYESALGRELLGKRVGETVEVHSAVSSWHARICAVGIIASQR